MKSHEGAMDFELEGVRFRRYDRGEGGRTVLWMTSGHAGASEERLLEGISRATDQDFRIIAMYAGDWNRDLSPWRFEYGGGVFEGCGRSTLDMIEGALADYCADSGIDAPDVIAGYSLAGLFALWASYESSAFSSVCCCSGSLWFGGWEEYSDRAEYVSPTSVYLSLGGKEPGSGDGIMATIGDCYARQRERLKRDPNASVHFVSNPGGHFSDPEGRLAKGISWILENGHRCEGMSAKHEIKGGGPPGI